MHAALFYTQSRNKHSKSCWELTNDKTFSFKTKDYQSNHFTCVLISYSAGITLVFFCLAVLGTFFGSYVEKCLYTPANDSKCLNEKERLNRNYTKYLSLVQSFFFPKMAAE